MCTLPYSVDNTKLISLKPGTYTISASKSGYMTYNNFLTVKPLHFSRQTIKLSDIFYTGAVATSDASANSDFNVSGSFLDYWTTDQSLVYFSTDANAFYKIKLASAQKTYDAPNTVGQKVIGINLSSSQTVGSVLYSSDGSQALVNCSSDSSSTIVLVNFAAASVANLPGDIVSANWLGTNQILAQTDVSPEQLIILDNNLNQIKTISNLDETSLSFAFNNQKVFVSSIESNNKYILDLTSVQKVSVNLAGSIINFTSGGNNQAIVQVLTSDNQTKNYLLNEDGTTKELNLSSDNLVWYSASQILYTQPESDSNYMDFKLYNVSNGESSILKTYNSDGSSIDAIVFSPSNIFFMSADQIMGFKK
jgi:hypothetical protein